ncbi:UNVERIFIED_CONTAM: E3 ubiquitin-protein ligase Iruka [Sesamum calycinum]|uniref:E3 ubiquitin-protein ligase Iruka n=1 Tax=Sesamum calycinum TaxID=2727403 RepID=A0AAW2SC30_9LAMI
MIYMLPVQPWTTSTSSSIHVRLRGRSYRHQRSTSPDKLRIYITVQVILQSSSAIAGVLGYYTTHKFLVQPEEFLSEQCSETVAEFIDLMNIPFSLDDNLYLTGSYEEGGVIECKSLENSQDLTRELAAGIRRIRDGSGPPTQDIILFIRKFATLPEDEFQEWKSFSESHRLEHQNLVHWDPEFRMHWRMAALRVLGKVRIEKGSGGDVPEWAEEPCPICLEELVKGDVIRLPCSHAYHEVCILTWIKNHQACPYCRAKSPDIKIDYEELRRNNRFVPYLNPNREMCSHVLQEMERLRRNYVGF